ncbi:MAG: hypothetical protein HN350_20470 [Phycisphaerales bacterium]|jgi:hypothetical protein|nr:hypothetical protein [Phycisphaerales bacterium]
MAMTDELSGRAGRRIVCISLWCAMMLITVGAGAADDPSVDSKAGKAIAKGKVSVVTEKAVSPKYMRDIFQRMKWRFDANRDTLKNESYSWDLYVPPSDKEELPGICVYVSPGGARGSGAGRWKSLMDKNNLIYIASRDSSNKVYTSHRLALTLRAIDIVKEGYKVNAKRIYLCGDSGGGRVSSTIAPMYPELVKGAIYSIGCSYWNHIPSGPKEHWPGFLGARTVPPKIAQFRKNRFVFITGDLDYNLLPTKAIYKAYLRSGVKNCVYFEVKGMAHSIAPVEYWQASFDHLDGKVVKKGPNGFETSPGDNKTPPPTTAKPTSRPSRTDEAIARSQLSLAGSYISAGLKAKAAAVLKGLITKYPKTQSAKIAAGLLETLGK